MPLALYTLSPSSPSDIDLLKATGTIHLHAFLTNEVNRYIFYGPPSSYPAIAEANRARHEKSLREDPTVRIVVIIDTDIPASDAQQDSPAIEQVIAFIKYNIYESAKVETESKDREWPSYTNIPLVSYFWGCIVDARRALFEKHGPHVLIGNVATSPDHMRRGAGRMLMQHAVDEADKRGMTAHLEASPEGFHLYESLGFRQVGEFWTDLERFENGGDKGDGYDPKRRQGVGEGWYMEAIMTRPKQS